MYSGAKIGPQRVSSMATPHNSLLLLRSRSRARQHSDFPSTREGQCLLKAPPLRKPCRVTVNLTNPLVLDPALVGVVAMDLKDLLDSLLLATHLRAMAACLCLAALVDTAKTNLILLVGTNRVAQDFREVPALAAVLQTTSEATKK